jgi:glycosyltransferase involved in cell wall biosynthesis
MSASWHLLTGEYPPDPGGIGDYTLVLAEALARAGQAVHVWGAPPEAVPAAGVTAHEEGRGWGGQARRRLDRALDAFPPPRRLLVQYAPRAFGAHGLNVGFCAWARGRGGRDRVDVMFHEPYLPFGGLRPARALAASMNRLMAALLLRTGGRIYVSTPMWSDLLRPWAPPGATFGWLPVASTVPRVEGPQMAERAAAIRSEAGGRKIVVHFGTYGSMIRSVLEPAAAGLLDLRSDILLVLLGRGGEAARAQIVAGAPSSEARVRATGALDRDDVSAWLHVADVALQPYPDGASARRTTLMAAVSHGVATVTNRGVATEEEWSGAVALVEGNDPLRLAETTSRLLEDPAERMTVARAGAALYERRFRIEHTVAALLAGTA